MISFSYMKLPALEILYKNKLISVQMAILCYVRLTNK